MSKPSYRDLENDVHEMDATIEGLSQAIRDMEAEIERLSSAIADVNWDLQVLPEVPADELQAAVDAVTERLHAALSEAL